MLLVAFRIVREIFPDDDWLALATVGLMATVPQHLAVSASIRNDLAAELVLVLILCLAVKRAKNTLSNRRFVILGGIPFGAARSAQGKRAGNICSPPICLRKAGCFSRSKWMGKRTKSRRRPVC